MTDAPSITSLDHSAPDACGEQLGWCSQLISEGIQTALASGLGALADELERRRRSTYDAAQSSTLSELKRELKQRGQTLPTEFARAFEALCRQHPGATAATGGPHATRPLIASEPLQIGDKIFSETLLIREQATLLREACQAELTMLEPAVAPLTDGKHNPLGPDAVSTALKQACWSLECSLDASLLLLQLTTGHIAIALPGIYRAALPTVLGHASTASTPPTPAQTKAPAGSDSSLQLAIAALKAGAQQADNDDTINLAQHLLDAGERSNGGLDALILENIATLFGRIFDNPHLPSEMKSLIGRLQLPVLETALRDHSFFSERAHPARRFIDTLTQAAITWDGSFSSNTALYRLAQPLVQRIRELGSAEHGTFSYALEMLQAFLAEQERIVERKTAAVARQLTEREARQIARKQANAAVARLTEDKTLPFGIRDLLQRRWRKVLTAAALNGGEHGTAWIAALAAMNDLVWSVRPKSSPQERQRLVELLPDLLTRIKTGLVSIDMPEEQRKQFFTRLVRLHAQAIKTGMQAADQEDPAATPASDTHPSAIGAEAPVPPTTLQRGDCIALTLDSGERCVVRLTWVSPAETMYLFSNRQGARAIALTRSELERRLAHGEAVRIDDRPITEHLGTRALDDPPPEPEQKP